MKWDKVVSAIIAVAGSMTNYILGGLDLALQTLLLFMLFDYLTGLICAIKDKELSSEIGFKGLFKKIMILVIVGVGVGLDKILGTSGAVRSLVIFFYISMEGISILENAARMDVGIPERLREVLLQLKEGNKKELKESDE